MSQSKILLEVGTNELEIVEFFINEEGGYRGYYGINVSKVVEIIRQQPVTAMPQMRHPCVKGAFPIETAASCRLSIFAVFWTKPVCPARTPRSSLLNSTKFRTPFWCRE